MKQQIISALAFPRFQIRARIDLTDCVHGGNFDLGDARCHECEFGAECEWLIGNDEFAALAEKPLPRLVDALEFSIGFIDAQITRWGHDTAGCDCESCTWLREAQALFERAYAEN